MVDPTFVEDTNFVVAACADNIQMALFSATVSKPVEDLIKTLFANAQVIRSSGSGKVVSSLRTQNRQIIDGKRWPVFEKILNNPIKGGTLIFVNTRDQCDKLAKEMTEMGYECLVYRGELDKIERRANLKKFIEGKVRFLVSTDLGGRGLDIDHVSRVVNYHLPREIENYLHRVGRTARAGRSGLVINLVTERDQPLIDQLESQIGSSDSKSTQD
jgi:superfamily II DNA/RNA helicase